LKAPNGGEWIKCGGMSNAAAFSFYANKIITTGEGGMVVTDSEQSAERARRYRNLYFGSPHRFRHSHLGYNFRMSNLQAAIGLAQMDRIEEFIETKRRNGEYYRQRLEGLRSLRFQVEKPWAQSVYWMYSVELEPQNGIDAETAISRLREKGIGTRPFFMGLHRQPALEGLLLGQDLEGFPKADHAYRYGFYLPSGINLKQSQIDRVCDTLEEVLEN
jgi:perosamine synthetase